MQNYRPETDDSRSLRANTLAWGCRWEIILAQKCSGIGGGQDSSLPLSSCLLIRTPIDILYERSLCSYRHSIGARPWTEIRQIFCRNVRPTHGHALKAI
jgi:hypothetical protein